MSMSARATASPSPPLPTADDLRASVLLLAQEGLDDDLIELLARNRINIRYDPPRLQNGDTALHLAASGGHEKCVVILLHRKVAADDVGHRLRTPLHCAVAGGHLLAASYLLKVGAKGDVKDQDGTTALELALRKGSYAMMRLFVKEWSKEDDTLETLTKLVLRLLSSGERTRAEEILKIALQSTQRADVIRAYVDAEPDLVRGEPGHSALLLSAREGRLQPLIVLLRAGVNPNARIYDNFTALHLAAMYGHNACLQQLLAQGAEVNAKASGGVTPLHMACWRGRAECVRVLLRKQADVNAKDNNGWTPLHKACYCGKAKCVALLLQGGALVNAKDNRKWTPLHRASSRGHGEIVEMLLGRGASVKAKDQGRWTPLHWASDGGHVQCVRMLLDRGGEYNARDNEGMTPILRAHMRNKFQCFEELIKRVPMCNPRDNKDGSPYHPVFNEELLEITRELMRVKRME